MKFDFRIYAEKADGTANYRFHKIRYTAALRFGIVLPADKGFLQLSFDGASTDSVDAHGDNKAFLGEIRLDGSVFNDVIAIIKPRESKPDLIVTFWPLSQHPDAHQSYTDPLVDTALDGTPFDIGVVATRMHEVFKVNAGASPATLMKLLFEEETDSLRASGQRLGELLEESFERERNASSELEKERAARTQAEKDRDSAKAEAEALRRKSYIQPPTPTSPVLSDPVLLVRATEGVAGKDNQRAVILYLADGTKRACNWQGGFDARLKYAKTLEGTKINTDVWGGWSGNKWFNNIYPALDSDECIQEKDDDIPF